MRIIRIKNLQESADTYCGMEIGAGEYYQLQSETEAHRFANDQHVQDHLSLSTPKISVGDGDKYFSTYLEGKEWIEGSEPLDPDGKPIKHSTPRKRGTYAYYSGSGDRESDPTNYGGHTDDAELFEGHHTEGQDLVQLKYFDINTIDNESHLRGGLIQWMGAQNDYITFEIVPKVTAYTVESGTNFYLFGGYLILPSEGSGNVAVQPGDMKLVQCGANEFGAKPAGYWDATWNPSTKLFESITPNANGLGNYNMFGYEVVLFRFINKLLMLGDGVVPISSDDITQLPHGGRVRITTKTRNGDHGWWWNSKINLYRKKTC